MEQLGPGIFFLIFTIFKQILINVFYNLKDFILLICSDENLPTKTNFLTLISERYHHDGRFLPPEWSNSVSLPYPIPGGLKGWRTFGDRGSSLYLILIILRVSYTTLGSKVIYIFLFKNEKFLQFGKSKVVIAVAFNDECEFNFHPPYS